MPDLPDGNAGLTFPWDAAPAEGEAVEVAEGVLWARLPLPMALDHVNVYFLREADGWSLVDTGFDTKRTRAIYGALLDGPLGGMPVTNVVVTHHHPDHVGLAGWFQGQGAQLWMTRTAWLMARMLTLDEQPVPTAETLAFCKRYGMDAAILEQRSGERPFNFADIVSPLPVGYKRLQSGQEVAIGGRRWRVAQGDGHAPEHAVLYEVGGDDLVLGGDQLLPGISPNLGLYGTEPDGDPVGDWLAACDRLAPLAREAHLVLPGHKLPYRGLPRRMESLRDNHVHALDRLSAHIQVPKTGGDCFAPLFKREITGDLYGLAFFEAAAHLNCLWHQGRARRWDRGDGVLLWQAV
ncbi:MAG: MBL fold metallo-hydrolase [Pseudomonadota bacterium]